MNRETWRSVKSMSWQEAERAIRAIYDPEIEKAREFAYKNAFACVFTALHDRFPTMMTGDMLHSIGVDAVEYAQGLDTPEELIERLCEATGFDIRLRTDQQPQKYLPKEEVQQSDRP